MTEHDVSSVLVPIGSQYTSRSELDDSGSCGETFTWRRDVALRMPELEKGGSIGPIGIDRFGRPGNRGIFAPGPEGKPALSVMYCCAAIVGMSRIDSLCDISSPSISSRLEVTIKFGDFPY